MLVLLNITRKQGFVLIALVTWSYADGCLLSRAVHHVQVQLASRLRELDTDPARVLEHVRLEVCAAQPREEVGFATLEKP